MSLFSFFCCLGNRKANNTEDGYILSNNAERSYFTTGKTPDSTPKSKSPFFKGSPISPESQNHSGVNLFGTPDSKDYSAYRDSSLSPRTQESLMGDQKLNGLPTGLSPASVNTALNSSASFSDFDDDDLNLSASLSSR